MWPRPPAPMTTHLSRGRQPLGGLGRGVVGGQAGVGQRRDVGRLQRVVDLDDAARRRLQVLGVPAVGVDAGELALASQCTSSPDRQARHSPQVISGCRITLSPSVTLVTAEPDRVHPAGVLVADRVRQLHLGIFSAHWPSRMCRSVRHTPAPPILTTTSNGPVGFGDRDLGHLEVLCGSRRPGRLASCSSCCAP